ncbi:MAG TPA: outer membrane beta-barrel protein [Gemmatimonadales bacterium]|nr:outer membrane beta-barrel protein [Gemmatimonadales bacterium]
MRRLSAVLAGSAILGALSLAARSAAAQGSLTITPWAGIYVPTKNEFSSVDNDIKRNNAFIGGLRLTFWGNSPLGLEFTGGYSPAKVEIAGGTINEDKNTNVFVGSAKLMLGISPASSSLGLYLGAGPALIRRGEDVTQESESATDWGGVVGAGVRLPLGSSLGFRIDLEDYLYDGDFSGDDDFQNDLVISAGLSLRF